MLFLKQKGRRKVFNRKSTGNQQDWEANLKLRFRLEITEVASRIDRIESNFRNLQTEWEKEKLLLRSQVGRIAKLRAVDEDDTPEVQVEMTTTAPKVPPPLSHAEIWDMARASGQVR